MTTSAEAAESAPSRLPGETITVDNQPLIEQRGLDVIPDRERRGRLRSLGFMWTGIMLNVLVVVYGALLPALGLNLWQCVAAIVIGNLTWIITGLTALPGPAAGTTTFMVSRSIMGIRGNRLITACNWLMQIGYEVLDMVLMALAVTALLGLAGVHVSTAAQVAIILVMSAAQVLLPVFGHAAIIRVLNLLAAPFAAVFLVLAWLTASRFEYVSTAPGSLTAFLGGVALIASASGLGWTPNATDMSRYLPHATHRGKLIAAVALGGGIPGTLLMILGACVATVTTAASDPVNGLVGAYPTWFVVIYLVLLLAQMAALNGINLYSSGLTLQAAGVPLNRWQAVLVDCVICTALSSVVVTSGSFYSAVSNFLLFSLVWFTPWAAIYTVAYFLRGGAYDIDAPPVLGWAGLTAQILGMLASLAWLVTSVWSGPLATSTHLELSVPSGLLVAGLTYYLIRRLGSKPARLALPRELPAPTS
ncbi:purine-cytosine permease family protein [Nocardia sp. NPDC003482]